MKHTWKSAVYSLPVLLVFAFVTSNIATAQALQTIDTAQTTSDAAMTVDAGSGAVLAGEPGGSSATLTAAASSDASLVAEPGGTPDPKLGKQDTPNTNTSKSEPRGWKIWRWFR